MACHVRLPPECIWKSGSVGVLKQIPIASRPFLRSSLSRALWRRCLWVVYSPYENQELLCPLTNDPVGSVRVLYALVIGFLKRKRCDHGSQGISDLAIGDRRIDGGPEAGRRRCIGGPGDWRCGACCDRGWRWGRAFLSALRDARCGEPRCGARVEAISV